MQIFPWKAFFGWSLFALILISLFSEFGELESYGKKFKKRKGNKTVKVRKVPKRLDLSGNDADAKMKGYLYMHSKASGNWRKVWIVLKTSALYEFAAEYDPAAADATPILGYKLEPQYCLV